MHFKDLTMNNNNEFEIKWGEKEFWFQHFQNEYNQCYFEFIESCKNKNYSETTQMHTHHIIPKYLLKSTPEESYFCDSKQNLILLSIEDHLTAHEIFANLYPDYRNQGAIDLLKGQCNEASKKWKQAGAYASHEEQRKNQTGFWDVQKQTDRARRSMLRPDALEIRSEGGKKGGRQRWLNKAITESDRYVWSYKGEPVVCTINCQTGGDIVTELQKVIPTPLKRVTPLLNGTRSTSYSWSCKKIQGFYKKIKVL